MSKIQSQIGKLENVHPGINYRQRCSKTLRANRWILEKYVTGLTGVRTSAR